MYCELYKLFFFLLLLMYLQQHLEPCGKLMIKVHVLCVVDQKYREHKSQNYYATFDHSICRHFYIKESNYFTAIIFGFMSYEVMSILKIIGHYYTYFTKWENLI